MATRNPNRLERYRVSFVENYLRRIAKKSDRILDVGCGIGQCRNSTPACYDGIDITDEPYTEDSSRDVDIVASSENIPSPKGPCDVVFTVGDLYLIPNPKKALSEFHRILRPGAGFSSVTTIVERKRDLNTKAELADLLAGLKWS